MNFSSSQFSTEWLRRADALARAAHLWIRRRALKRLCDGKESSSELERGYAGGLIEGLAESMELSEQEHQMAAYAFCLLSGEDQDTLRSARALLDAGMDPTLSGSYLDGLSAAQTLYVGVRIGFRQDEVSVVKQTTRSG